MSPRSRDQEEGTLRFDMGVEGGVSKGQGEQAPVRLRGNRGTAFCGEQSDGGNEVNTEDNWKPGTGNFQWPPASKTVSVANWA